MTKTDLEVGDIMCVHYTCATRDTIRDMVTSASVVELRHTNMASISLSAELVWQLTAEVLTNMMTSVNPSSKTFQVTIHIKALHLFTTTIVVWEAKICHIQKHGIMFLCQVAKL